MGCADLRAAPTSSDSCNQTKLGRTKKWGKKEKGFLSKNGLLTARSDLDSVKFRKLRNKNIVFAQRMNSHIWGEVKCLCWCF